MTEPSQTKTAEKNFMQNTESTEKTKAIHIVCHSLLAARKETKSIHITIIKHVSRTSTIDYIICKCCCESH